MRDGSFLLHIIGARGILPYLKAWGHLTSQFIIGKRFFYLQLPCMWGEGTRGVIKGTAVIRGGVLFTLVAMSRTPFDASPSPERFCTTSLPRTSAKVKELHKGSKHDEDSSKSRSTHHERLSYSQSPSPSAKSAGDESTAPTLGMIMNALTDSGTTLELSLISFRSLILTS